MKKLFVFSLAVIGTVLAVATPNTYAASGQHGTVLACRAAEARCQTSDQCCNHNCVWVGQENRCR